MTDMAVKGVGIDIAEVRRFFRFRKDGNDLFLTKNFTERELEYCFSFADPAVHLAGTFAAKEAVWKALGRSDVFQSVIEIRREESGKPVVWIKNRRQKSILVSTSHTKQTAVAIAVCSQSS